MKGQCLCGSVRYELKTAPQQAYYCHCRDCQYLSGSSFHLLAIVDKGSISRLSGKLGSFTHPTEDGADMTREFCLNCGTPMYVSSTRFDNIEMFTRSSLDDPDCIEPSFEIWTRSKSPAAQIDPGIKSYRNGAEDA